MNADRPARPYFKDATLPVSVDDGCDGAGPDDAHGHRDGEVAIGGSRKTLSAIVNGRAGISPEMAVRLSMAFDTTSESWLNQQVQYDLWQAERKRKKLRVKPLAA